MESENKTITQQILCSPSLTMTEKGVLMCLIGNVDISKLDNDSQLISKAVVIALKATSVIRENEDDLTIDLDNAKFRCLFFKKIVYNNPHFEIRYKDYTPITILPSVINMELGYFDLEFGFRSNDLKELMFLITDAIDKKIADDEIPF